MTQGRNDGSEWVTSFMVSHSMDAYQWLYITDLYGNQKVSILFNQLITCLVYLIHIHTAEPIIISSLCHSLIPSLQT